MNQFRRRYLVLVGLGCLLISLVYLIPQVAIADSLIAQSDLGLKSDVISLQARISRLEQEVNRLRSDRSTPSPSRKAEPQQPSLAPVPPRPTVVNPPIVNGRAIGKSDSSYERLATLLIELKEDVRNLDRRLTEIEQSNP